MLRTPALGLLELLQVAKFPSNHSGWLSLVEVVSHF